MKISKLILAAVLAAIIRYAANSGFGYYFSSLYDPVSGIWRAMMTPSWVQNVLVMNLVIGFILVIAYVMMNKGLGKKSDIAKKGAKFGIITWLLSDVTMSIVTFVFIPISVNLVYLWLISGLIISMINGFVIAAIYK